LLERHYIQRNPQKYFEPTEMGFLVNQLLVQHFPQIVDVGFTAKMEKDLDEIAEGRLDWKKNIADFYWAFEKQLEQKYKEVERQEINEETEEICEKCGRKMVYKMSRYGKFLACSGFPECKNIKNFKKESQKLDIKCPKCSASPERVKRNEVGEIVLKRTKNGRFFYGCSRYPACDFALWDKPVNQFCEKCGAIMVEKKKEIVCSNKECNK